MIERPLFVPTPDGPLAAMLTLPDGDPAALVMVMQGYGGTRSGANQMLTRLAHALAAEGVATLRADYAGAAESFDAGPSERVAGVRTLVEASRTVVPNAPLYLVASCYGVGPAVHVAADIDVAGIAVVSPLIIDRTPKFVVNLRSKPVRRAIGRLRHRLRYGSRRVPPVEQSDNVDTQDGMRELATRAPLFVLGGSEDRTTQALYDFLETMPEPVELEVAEGCAIHSSTTPEAQFAMQDGVRRWMVRNIGSNRLTS